jgi:hypothetical protein
MPKQSDAQKKKIYAAPVPAPYSTLLHTVLHKNWISLKTISEEPGPEL